MGICMMVKRKGTEKIRNFNLSYRGYHILRGEVLKVLDKELGNKFLAMGYDNEFTDDEYVRLANTGLLEFIFHSDFNGILKLKTIKKVSIILSKIELEDREWNRCLNELKNLFYKAIRKGSDIEYL